ncbi:MAG: hypothetical protein AB7V25_12450 [Mangrovibacterium sp.]
MALQPLQKNIGLSENFSFHLFGNESPDNFALCIKYLYRKLVKLTDKPWKLAVSALFLNVFPFSGKSEKQIGKTGQVIIFLINLQAN